MFRTLRYLTLIFLISSGYYLFISEYFNLSKTNFLEREIVKKEIKDDKKEIIQEIKEAVPSASIKKNIDKVNIFTRLIKSLNYLIWGDV